MLPHDYSDLMIDSLKDKQYRYSVPQYLVNVGRATNIYSAHQRHVQYTIIVMRIWTQMDVH